MKSANRPTFDSLATLTIDPEFQARCGKLQDHELELLRQQLKAEGCRDKIKTWKGVILDGHNRHFICTEGNIAFEVEEIDLPDREHALHWIDCWQAGRRNEDKADREERVGRIYEFRKRRERGGGDRRSDHFPQNEGNGREHTAQRVARELGVSRATVERAGEYVRGLDKIEAEHGPEARAGAKRTKTRQEVRDIGKDKVDSEPPTEPQPPTDEAGNVVPEQLRHVFEALGEFDAIQREHDALRRRVEKLAETEAGKWLHLVSYTSHIRNARADVKFSRPYAVCPYPHERGKACEACRDLGWVHKSIYDNAPKEW